MNSYSVTHIVFKKADIEKYLSIEDQYELEYIKSKIALGRVKDKKKAYNTYLVVNTDEKYANEVMQLIELDELDKHI